MDELLPHYERELALLRRSTREFAERFPKIAARLGMTDGENDDPHLGRLLQSFALLGARIGRKLDDDYPLFPQAVIDTLYPGQLRPFPSCSIAQFDAGATLGQLTAPVTVPLGTELEDRAGTCRFRTSYDVTLAPISIERVGVAPAAAASPRSKLPSNTSVVLSITFASLTDEKAFRTATPDRIRVHLHGMPACSAALVDAMLLHAPAAFVESDHGGHWKHLPHVPLKPAGYDERDALVPHTETEHAPWRLLREYFAFPDKFAFVDIDFAMLARAAGPCRKLTLHLPIVDVPDSSPMRVQLDAITTDHLRLGCTPIVNLFSRDAMPITLGPGAATYTVTPHVLSMRGITIRSIDTVRLVTDGAPDASGGTPVPCYRGFVHERSSRDAPAYWLASDREQGDAGSLDRHPDIRLVDLTGRTIARPDGQLLLGLTCTNGNHPATLPFGAPDGDLFNENDNLAGRVTLLRAASRCRALPARQRALWQLVAGLAPHVLTLNPGSVDTLRAMLRLLAAEASGPTPIIDAIVGVSHRSVMQWTAVKPMSTFVRGIEVTVNVEPSALNAASVYACSRMLDPFFAHFAPANGFVQCVIRDADSGRERVRCPARFGTTPIL
ncbi:type VI secretion protein [Burkholderia lata]|uniref:Type VI secretion protein n=1 Tax=Burkholderia lata (strain ATCC 17760 / DSM 23089 / LMG 22485 / NCIMB 9086 / R18194 / 383) TaxID=482957 RepID=A0A6P2UK54_BURL3|nr:type VI secretion system baseplate subunit TssF [Burkholderia lata]VWC74163.1 type VI secretion protein [Burkholderia lata]